MIFRSGGGAKSLLFFLSASAPAQMPTYPAAAPSPVVSTAAGVGVAGSPFPLPAVRSAKPFGLSWTIAGTPPPACLWVFEVSSNGADWSVVGAPQDCTAGGGGMWNPVPFAKMARMRLTTYTPGDATTAVTLTYTPGAM